MTMHADPRMPYLETLDEMTDEEFEPIRLHVEQHWRRQRAVLIDRVNLYVKKKMARARAAGIPYILTFGKKHVS